MSMYYSANYDLKRLIKTHLFVISPNNSGSTFLKNALATSQHTWNLNQEGQHTFGFSGPVPYVENFPLIWAAKPDLLEKLRTPELYDWKETQKAWYFLAHSKTSNASIFVEKSPPSVVRVSELNQHFFNPKFIFLLRNPYAVVEGIYRRYKKLGKKALKLASIHIVTLFYIQKSNILNHNNSIFFTYEEMCSNPKKIENNIKSLVPELTDITLEQKIEVKGIYDEMLRDMNAQQIERLSPKDIAEINKVFYEHKTIINYFGYQILESS